MDREAFVQLLKDYEACREAQKWVETTPGSPQELWAKCERGDWMLWLLARSGTPSRVYREIACDVVGYAARAAWAAKGLCARAEELRAQAEIVRKYIPGLPP